MWIFGFFNLIEKAFKTEIISAHEEQFLVKRLRKSEAFFPELSLIAEIDREIVGHILVTKLKIQNESNEFDSLALVPVSVLPKFQNPGIGRRLIIEAQKVAKKLGHKSIVLLGQKKITPDLAVNWQMSVVLNYRLKCRKKII